MHSQEYAVDPKKVEIFQSKLLKWHKNINRGLPWRKRLNPYSILVSEIMLHQTSAKKVVPVYEEIMRKHPTFQDLAKADIDDLKSTIYPLGLNYRANVLKEIAQEVVSGFNGTLPNTKKELLTLPSVGEYTSSAILSFVYNETIAIVDTNVIRVIGRVFGFPIMEKRDSPDKPIINLANTLIPHNKSKQYNFAILDFGSLICTHYKPKCNKCSMGDICCHYKT